MAIYRGPGGSGDATNDAASEVLLATAAKDAAIAAQVAAEIAQANAETAETNAETAAAAAATFDPALYVAKANNLSDLTSATTARTNLGLGSIATQATNNVSITGGSISGITDLAIADGGTGASDASGARTNLGLGTIATQAANNVALTGGSINGTTVGATTATSGKFTTLEATGVTTVQAGTNSAPAITTSGDTNTGIFFPAADTIGLVVGGVESARVVSGLLSIPANSTTASAVRLYEDTDNGANYVDVIAPSAITSNRILTIPDETGTILTTGSSGQSIPKAALPAGSVLQVVSTTVTTSFSTTSGSFTALGLSASITPTSATSKIYIVATFPMSTQSSNLSLQNVLLRGSTQIIVSNGNYAASAGWLLTNNIITFLDSPATTSSTTYSISCRVSAGAGTISSADESTITLLEIAA